MQSLWDPHVRRAISFALINITASCFFGIDEIKTAFLMYALASFHLDCALAECLAYSI